MGKSVFESCEILNEITIPDKVTGIEKGAFGTNKALGLNCVKYKGETYMVRIFEKNGYNYYDLPDEFYDVVNG